MSTSAPLTREQVDSIVDELTTFARQAGLRLRQADEAAGRSRQIELPPEAWDAKERAGLMLSADLRAAIILSLDDQDRLAACDRSDLVAEALMLRSR